MFRVNEWLALRKSFRIFASGLLLAILLFMLPATVCAKLLLGVHPYLAPDHINEHFKPLADYLSLKLDMEVEVRVGRDYESHIQAVGRNTIDLALLGPASYVKMVNKYGRKPILARFENNGKPVFNGHIIVRADSELKTLTDLKQKYFAFGDKNSTMSRLVPQAMLLQHEITLDQLSGYRYLNGHRNVAMAVLSGDADAGAIKEEVFLQFKDKGIRSLAKTPQISEHLFVTRSDMDPALIRQLQKIMMEINKPLQVVQLLKPINKKLTGLVKADDRDYDSIRELIFLLESRHRI